MHEDMYSFSLIRASSMIHNQSADKTFLRLQLQTVRDPFNTSHERVTCI